MGKEMRFGIPIVKSKCIRCEMPTSNCTIHTCYLRKRMCICEMKSEYRWAESLCRKKEWYDLEHHVCTAKCKNCDGVFVTADRYQDNIFFEHLRNCPKSMKEMKDEYLIFIP